MNAGVSTEPDFALTDTTVDVVNDLAIVELEVFDYGGFTTARATATDAPDTGVVRVPYDDEEAPNLLPQAGWKAGGDLVPDAGESAGDDTDAEPQNNAPGDGLSRYEEYRGFVVMDEHLRTDPGKKDIFVFSAFMEEGIGYAWALPLAVHEVEDSEFEEVGGRIAPNYTNSSGDPIPGHFFGTMLDGSTREQRAIRIGRNDNFGLAASRGVAGATVLQRDALNNSVLGPPWTVDSAAVFVRVIRAVSPPTDSETTVEAMDTSKIKQTIAHEIGHWLAVDDRIHPANGQGIPQCPPIATTIMAWKYFSKTTDVNDCAWNNIPQTFDANDTPQLRVR